MIRRNDPARRRQRAPGTVAGQCGQNGGGRCLRPQNVTIENVTIEKGGHISLLWVKRLLRPGRLWPERLSVSPEPSRSHARPGQWSSPAATSRRGGKGHGWVAGAGCLCRG